MHGALGYRDPRLYGTSAHAIGSAAAARRWADCGTRRRLAGFAAAHALTPVDGGAPDLPCDRLDPCLGSAVPFQADTPPTRTSTIGTPILKPPTELKPGECFLKPELSPRGPMVIVVSLPRQLAYVYRNGVVIGASTVSSGKHGHETPTGVFTVLQKHADHYSNVYDSAPMPTCSG